MTRAHRILFAVVALHVGSSPLGAQAADTAAILSPVMVRIRQGLPRGRVVEAQSRAEVDRLVSCVPARPESCHLVGADFVIYAAAPTIADDTAYVTVAVWRKSRDQRGIVEQTSLRYRVVRIDGHWLPDGVVDRTTL